MSDDAELDPMSALRTYQQQRRKTLGDLRRAGRISYLIWGLAWLVGYGALWIGAGPEGFPQAWAFWVFGISLLVGIVVSTISSVAGSRDMTGRSRAAGALFGPATTLAWIVGMVSISIVVQRFQAPEPGFITPAAAATLYNLVASLLVGSQFTAAGAIFGDRTSYALGIVMLIACLAGTAVGVPAGYLVMALIGGGGMLVALAISEARIRHTDRQLSS